MYNLPGSSASITEILKEIKIFKPKFEYEFTKEKQPEEISEFPRKVKDDSNIEWGWTQRRNINEVVNEILSLNKDDDF